MVRHLTLLLFLLLLPLVSYGVDEKQEKERPYIVVIDTKTQYIFKADPKIKLPTVHPRTGKETITRAMYCDKCSICARWKAVPLTGTPMDNPEEFSCPIHGELLTADGKIPNDLKFIEDIKVKRSVSHTK